jgi:hypothetical protein
MTQPVVPVPKVQRRLATETVASTSVAEVQMEAAHRVAQRKIHCAR